MILIGIWELTVIYLYGAKENTEREKKTPGLEKFIVLLSWKIDTHVFIIFSFFYIEIIFLFKQDLQRHYRIFPYTLHPMSSNATSYITMISLSPSQFYTHNATDNHNPIYYPCSNFVGWPKNALCNISPHWEQDPVKVT